MAFLMSIVESFLSLATSFILNTMINEIIMSTINIVIRIIDIMSIIFDEKLFIIFIRFGVTYLIVSAPSIENGVIVSRHILPLRLYFMFV